MIYYVIREGMKKGEGAYFTWRQPIERWQRHLKDAHHFSNCAEAFNALSAAGPGTVGRVVCVHAKQNRQNLPLVLSPYQLGVVASIINRYGNGVAAAYQIASYLGFRVDNGRQSVGGVK